MGIPPIKQKTKKHSKGNKKVSMPVVFLLVGKQ